MLYPLTRPLFFLLPPEIAHRAALQALTLTNGFPYHLHDDLTRQPCQVMGLRFPNRLGLAAGMDKNADYLGALGQLGFGFIEVGTVTPRPQPGNPRPRLFRLPRKHALINRMGFNNKGLDYLLTRLQRRRFDGVLGVNLGKNRDTPLENALDDYLQGMKQAYPLADYIAINISSPNTPGLRELQHGGELDRLLAGLKEAQAVLWRQHSKKVPLAVKIAPDFRPDDLQATVESLLQHEIEGVIATNTTLAREAVQGQRFAGEAGGLSGAPLFDAATATVRTVRSIAGNRLAIIAAGGVLNGAQAVAKLTAGADLVQIYTGLIYRGPGLIGEILAAMRKTGC